MNVAVVAGRYKGWSGWFLKNGPVELVLVPQVGGRIMGIRWRGHQAAGEHGGAHAVGGKDSREKWLCISYNSWVTLYVLYLPPSLVYTLSDVISSRRRT